MVRIGTGIGMHYPGSVSGEVFNDYSNNIAEGNYSHAEGSRTIANGDYSHAEGYATLASGYCSHAEGSGTTSLGDYSHTEGGSTSASGEYSHAEGYKTKASGKSSHAEGNNTKASGSCSHAEGYYAYAIGLYSHAEGGYTKASGSSSHAEGYYTEANGNYSHAEGYYTEANGNYSHAEGYRTKASGSCSHAEGSGTIASGRYSHAEGNGTIANGDYSHAEGLSTNTIGRSSHAEGNGTIANGNYSHAEGWDTKANGRCSHSEGDVTAANADYSHAGGLSSSANGVASFSHGISAISQNEGEIALGLKNSSVYTSMLEGELTARATLFSVGMGIDGTARNAMELKYNGDLYLYGAGNYNGRNSLGNAAYDSTVQTVQSLLSNSSGNKFFICATDKTDLTKVANDESIPVEVGSVVTVLFQNGSSASTSTNSIYLNINGHQAQVVAPNNMNNSVGSFRMLPPYLDTGSILSFAYDGTRWIVVGNPLLATLTTFEDGFNFILEIYANRVMKYYISRENLQTGMSYSFGFPIPFSDFVSGICYGAANMALRTNTVNFTVSSGGGTDFYAIITGRI